MVGLEAPAVHERQHEARLGLGEPKTLGADDQRPIKATKAAHDYRGGALCSDQHPSAR